MGTDFWPDRILITFKILLVILTKFLTDIANFSVYSIFGFLLYTT